MGGDQSKWLLQVYFAIEAWKKVLPAKEQAKLEEDIANERKAANERANKPGPQGSFHQRAASRAVKAESDEDDEPLISEALTLDQAIEVLVVHRNYIL